MTDSGDSLRLDKWLWAARFYKTRALASRAISGGHVHLNGERIKPAKAVKCGDTVRVRKDALEITVVVEALSARRGPASVAQMLYQETPASAERREQARAQLRAQLRAQRIASPADSKPDKHTRRELLRIKKSSDVA